VKEIIKNGRRLIEAYKNGELGQTIMPEDSNPHFLKSQKEERFCYFSLPMALNYQRDSYKLWEAALKTYNDPKTKKVFDLKVVSQMSEPELRKLLTKYKLALQPNKHIATWQKIAQTVVNNWGSFSNMLESIDNDFLILRDLMQCEHKKGFPYLSGPKIFNYWSYILGEYCGVKFKNAKHIDIAPDTHITKCSVILSVITEEEAKSLSKEQISDRWRDILADTGINPIDLHAPLWFWSRNGFLFKL